MKLYLKLDKTHERYIKEADDLAKEAMEERDFRKLSSSNDLHDKAKTLQVQMEANRADIDKLKEKMKHVI